MTDKRKAGEPWGDYQARVGGCPPVDLQPDEGVPLGLRAWLMAERRQREGRLRRALADLGEVVVLLRADQGGHPGPLVRAGGPSHG